MTYHQTSFFVTLETDGPASADDKRAVANAIHEAVTRANEEIGLSRDDADSSVVAVVSVKPASLAIESEGYDTKTLAAQTIIDAHTAGRGLEEGNGAGTDLYHVLDSLLTWCDFHRVDFDAILSDLRRDYAIDAANSARASKKDA